MGMNVVFFIEGGLGGEGLVAPHQVPAAFAAGKQPSYLGYHLRLDPDGLPCLGTDTVLKNRRGVVNRNAAVLLRVFVGLPRQEVSLQPGADRFYLCDNPTHFARSRVFFLLFSHG